MRITAHYFEPFDDGQIGNIPVQVAIVRLERAFEPLRAIRGLLNLAYLLRTTPR
jgi:hypothetical protein